MGPNTDVGHVGPSRRETVYCSGVIGSCPTPSVASADEVAGATHAACWPTADMEDRFVAGVVGEDV